MLRDEHARPLECGDSSPLSFSPLSLACDASFHGFPPQQERKAMPRHRTPKVTRQRRLRQVHNRERRPEAFEHFRLCVKTATVGSIVAMMFSRDNHTLITGSGDCTLRVWDTCDRQERSVFTGHSSAVPVSLSYRSFEGIDATTHKLRFRSPKRSVTARQLLTHTAGFSYEMRNPLVAIEYRQLGHHVWRHSIQFAGKSQIEQGGVITAAIVGRLSVDRQGTPSVRCPVEHRRWSR